VLGLRGCGKRSSFGSSSSKPGHITGVNTVLRLLCCFGVHVDVTAGPFCGACGCGCGCARENYDGVVSLGDASGMCGLLCTTGDVWHTMVYGMW
jgi:hypothetical protein